MKRLPPTETATQSPEGRIQELLRTVEELKQEVSSLRTRHLRAGERDVGLGSLLTEREALFAEVERLAHVGSWLWDVRTHEVAWSDEFYRIFGYEPGQDAPTVENFYAALHPDDRPRLAESSVIGSNTGVIEPGARCRIVHRDGAIRHVVLMGAPIRDQAGQLIRIVGAALDVTEFVTVEKELRRTAALLNEAERVASLGSWNFIPSEDRIEWSDTMYALFGIEPGTTVTREAFLSRVHPEDRERIVTVRLEGAQTSVELRVLRPDGSVRHLRLDANTERNAEGRVHRMHGTAQDVTSRKQLEEQLRHSQKMEAIGTLAGGIAHDFNNYLVVINGNVDLLKEVLRPDAPEQDMLNEIATAAGRCGALTRQLLAFSRKHVAATRLVDPVQLVSESAKMLERLLGEHIELRLQTQQGVGVVRVDPAHLEQAIVNLAVNARDAMPDGGTLTIEASAFDVSPEFAYGRAPLEPGPHVRISVRDTGSGIPEDIQPRIFEPFFTTKGPGLGTGLGLTTVYGIVRQCHGHVEFQSRAGLGTEFSIYLRVAAAAPDPDHAEEAAVPLSNGETVLVAEDEPQVRRLTRTLLLRAGYKVFVAEDGLEALRVARELPRIDLLVTDVRMPRLGGLELARRLREERPNLRVLYMSGYLDLDSKDEGKDDFRRALMQKPFTMRQLLASVRKALDEEIA